MKRIVFLTLFSVLLPLFVSSVQAAMQERTLRIENRKELDVRVAYCYVVDTNDVNKIGEKAGHHVKGWVRVPSGRSITVTYPKTGYTPLFLLGVTSDGRQLIPKQILLEQELPIHPKKNFEVLLALNGVFIDATTENNGSNHRVGERDLDWFKFGKKSAQHGFVWEIDGPKSLDYDGYYDMEGFRREEHGKDYALLFATNEYKHWPPLKTPIADADAIGAELKNRYGFFKVDIRPNVTIKQILDALTEYKAKRYATGDQLFVYFAGHGEFDKGLKDGTIAGTESELPTTDKNLSTYLSFRQLRGILDDFPCERIMLMLDVCYGGTFDEDIARDRPKEKPTVRGALSETQYLLLPTQDLLRPEDTLKEKTRWYVSSGGKEQVQDGDGNHSPFASALLTLLRGNNQDGVLTLPEIERQLPSQFEGELDKLRGMYTQVKIEQTPLFGPFGSSKPDESNEENKTGVRQEAEKVFLLIESN